MDTEELGTASKSEGSASASASASASVRYSTATVGVAVQALGHIGLSGPLFPSHERTRVHAGEASGGRGTGGVEGQREDEGQVVSAGAVVRQLVALLSHRDDKLVQSAVQAMGHISFGEAGEAAGVSWEGLRTLARSKVREGGRVGERRREGGVMRNMDVQHKQKHTGVQHGVEGLSLGCGV